MVLDKPIETDTALVARVRAFLPDHISWSMGNWTGYTATWALEDCCLVISEGQAFPKDTTLCPYQVKLTVSDDCTEAVYSLTNYTAEPLILLMGICHSVFDARSYCEIYTKEKPSDIYMKDGESFVIPWCVGNNHGVVVKPQQTYRAVIPLHRWQSAQPFQLVSMSHILYTWKRLSRVNRVERILHLE